MVPAAAIEEIGDVAPGGTTRPLAPGVAQHALFPRDLAVSAIAERATAFAVFAAGLFAIRPSRRRLMITARSSWAKTPAI